MERRTFVAMLTGGIVVVPFAAIAQSAAKTIRIGYLAANLAASPHLQQAFLQGLRDLGYVEGRNLAIEYRSAEGKLDRLPALAAELVSLKVDSSWAQAHLRPWPPSKRPGLSPLSSPPSLMR